jgi:hypothetical protein
MLFQAICKSPLPLNPGARATWEAISLMARSEWICWIQSAK